MIEVFYSGGKHATVEFSIGKHSETVTSNTGILGCNIELSAGVHVLKLCLKSDTNIVIDNVKVNGTGLREWLYLSWAIDSTGTRRQSTQLKSAEQCIYVPFATPMSLWMDLVLSKLSCHDMSKDIHQTHHLYFSNNLELDSRFPALVRDFFSNEFDFTVVEKSSKDLIKIPYLELAIDPVWLRPLAVASKKLFESGRADHAVKKSLVEDPYLKIDNPNWQPESRARMKIIEYRNNLPTELIGPDLLPEFNELVDHLKIQNIYSAQINFIEPGSYAPPHRDYEVRDNGYPDDADGCCQVYIPLISDANNYLKIGGVGVFEIGTTSLAINNNYYTHAVVNAGQATRSVLIIRCNLNKNWHLVASS